MNHYKFIERFGQEFSDLVGLKYSVAELSVPHGDKCYGFKDEWEDAGIPFNHGAMIYLLSFCSPYSSQCRTTETGWVPVEDWVMRFAKNAEIKAFFERCEKQLKV